MKSHHVVTRVITLELDENDAYKLKRLVKNYQNFASDMPDGTEVDAGEKVFMGKLLSALNHNVDYEDET